MTHNSIGISALVMGMALSPLACGGGSQAGTGGAEQQPEAEGDGDGDGGDDLPEGDGDPSTGDGDPEPLCDVSQLPALEPLWLESNPQDPIGAGFIRSLTMSEDALFVGAGYTYLDGSPPDHHLARRTLEGNGVWAVGVPELGYTLQTDGVHVYYDDGASPGSVYRVSVDGLDEGWSLPLPSDKPLGNVAIRSGQDTLVVYGSSITEVGDPPYTDAFVAEFEKGGKLLGTAWFGETGRDDSAFRVAAAPGGGYYFLVYHGTSGQSFSIEGYGLSGDTYSVSLETSGWATSLVHLGDGLLAAGIAGNSIWTRKLSLSGEQLSDKYAAPCEDLDLRYVDLVQASDRLWGNVDIDDGSMHGRSVLIQVDLEGQLLGTYRVEGLTDGARVHGLVSNGEAVVISAYDHDTPEGYQTFLARLQ